MAETEKQPQLQQQQQFQASRTPGPGLPYALHETAFNETRELRPTSARQVEVDITLSLGLEKPLPAPLALEHALRERGWTFEDFIFQEGDSRGVRTYRRTLHEGPDSLRASIYNGVHGELQLGLRFFIESTQPLERINKMLARIHDEIGEQFHMGDADSVSYAGHALDAERRGTGQRVSLGAKTLKLKDGTLIGPELFELALARLPEVAPHHSRLSFTPAPDLETVAD